MISTFSGEHRWLSNFYPARVRYKGREAPTVEHAYQAAKTNDPQWQARILAAETPGKAKRLGRKVPLTSDWEERKVSVMYVLLRQKFAPGSKLAAQLLATGDQELVEGNTWHDNFWGSCTCPRCGGHGRNILGKLLMEIREVLRAQHTGR